MKRISFAIISVFCVVLGAFLCSFVSSGHLMAEQIVEQADEWQEMGAQEFYTFISGYPNNNNNLDGSKARIRLTEDIDFSKSIDGVLDNTLTKTIGNSDVPFGGVIDGNGHTISNMTIDLTESEGDSVFGALFGVTNGATIQNLAIAGTTTIITGERGDSFVGGLVASAQNTTIKNVQITSKVVRQTTKDGEKQQQFLENVSFGGLAGIVKNSTISNVIFRADNAFGNFEITEEADSVHALGGLVGRVENSTVSFAIVDTDISCTIGENFFGRVSLGAVAGAVGGDSKLVNLAVESDINLTDPQNKCVAGEIVGEITTVPPKSGSLSSIHFKDNANLDLFGNIGTYKYKDKDHADNITSSTLSMAGSDENVRAYFNQQNWDTFEGEWNFDTVWWVSEGNVCLQNFYQFDAASVSVVNDSSEVLKFDNITIDGQSISSKKPVYGDQLELNFHFLNGMDKFYAPTHLQHKGVIVADIFLHDDSYAISAQNGYDLSIRNLQYTESGSDDGANTSRGFAIIINGLNLKTLGEYSVEISSLSFTGNVTTKLQNDQSGFKPGFVNLQNGTSVEVLSIPASYNQTFVLETNAKPKTAYTFIGWFLADENGEIAQDDVAISVSPRLSIVFGNEIAGTGKVIDGDFNICALYYLNACEITVQMDDGVMRVVLGRRENDQSQTGTVFETSNEKMSVAKSERSFKLDIYVDRDYEFDPDDFETELQVFKSGNQDGEDFCIYDGNEEGEDCVIFHFTLNIESLQGGDYENAVTINVRTNPVKDSKLSWIWWIVGGICGAFVLVSIIILIVWLIRRNRGNFGGGNVSKMPKDKSSTKTKKQSFKNMYY